MSRLAAILVFASVGSVTAWIAARIVLASAPICGYDCENRSFGIWFWITIASMAGFTLLGQLFTRGPTFTYKRLGVVTAALTVVALLAAASFYVWQAHVNNVKARTVQRVEADVDYMFMTIATRDVQTYTDSADGSVKRATVVHQWQRCALDGAWCDRRPRQAHMRCQTGEVYVSEEDWHAFALIPRENARGAVPLKSMDLCTPGNQPDD